MTPLRCLLVLLCGCAPAGSAAGLSGDEDIGIIDPGPTTDDGGDGAAPMEDGSLGGAASASMSGWIATPSVLDAPDAVVDGGTLSARTQSGVVVCQHTDLVAPCGTLAGGDGFAWDSSAALGTFRYALTSDGSDALCRWTVSYALLGVDGGGTLEVSVDADGVALDGATVSVAIPPDTAR
jgi:hypothetical protein